MIDRVAWQALRLTGPRGEEDQLRRRRKVDGEAMCTPSCEDPPSVRRPGAARQP